MQSVVSKWFAWLCTVIVFSTFPGYQQLIRQRPCNSQWDSPVFFSLWVYFILLTTSQVYDHHHAHSHVTDLGAMEEMRSHVFDYPSHAPPFMMLPASRQWGWGQTRAMQTWSAMSADVQGLFQSFSHLIRCLFFTTWKTNLMRISCFFLWCPIELNQWIEMSYNLMHLCRPYIHMLAAEESASERDAARSSLFNTLVRSAVLRAGLYYLSDWPTISKSKVIRDFKV